MAIQGADALQEVSSAAGFGEKRQRKTNVNTPVTVLL